MNPHEKALVIAYALVSANSVRNYLLGKTMRPAIQARIEGAMRKLELGAFIRPAPPAPSAKGKASTGAAA